MEISVIEKELSINYLPLPISTMLMLMLMEEELSTRILNLNTDGDVDVNKGVSQWEENGNYPPVSMSSTLMLLSTEMSVSEKEFMGTSSLTGIALRLPRLLWLSFPWVEPATRITEAQN